MKQGAARMLLDWFLLPFTLFAILQPYQNPAASFPLLQL